MSTLTYVNINSNHSQYFKRCQWIEEHGELRTIQQESAWGYEVDRLCSINDDVATNKRVRTIKFVILWYIQNVIILWHILACVTRDVWLGKEHQRTNGGNLTNSGRCRLWNWVFITFLLFLYYIIKYGIYLGYISQIKHFRFNYLMVC